MSPEILISPETPFVTERVWPNGFRLLIHRMPHAQSVTGSLFLLKTGPRWEKPSLVGSHHLVEHWISNPALEKPGHLAFYNAVTAKGGRDGEETGLDDGVYQVKLFKEDVSTLIPFSYELTCKPRLKTKDLEKERRMVLEEILEEVDQPSKHIVALLLQKMWKGYPVGMGYSSLGTAESVSSFTKEDLVKEYERIFRPDNMLLVVAGDFDEEQIIRQVEETFGSVARQPSEFNDYPIPVYKPDGSRVSIKEKDLEQVQIALAFPVEKSLLQKHYYGLRLLRAMAVRAVHFRLVEVLGKGYTADAIPLLHSDFGAIALNSSVRKRNALLTVEKMVEEINNLALEEEAVLLAKRALRGDFILDLESTGALTEYIGEAALTTGKILSPDELKTTIDNIPAEVLTRLKSEIFRDENAVLVMLGPISEDEAPKFEDKLQFGR